VTWELLKMDRPQLFWDVFRQTWRRNLRSWTPGGGTKKWTASIIKTAKEACYDYAQELGRKVVVGGERYGRIDVHATDVDTGELLVAFESELAWWGYNGSSGKDWRQEFPKLCRTKAELRVLSSTFQEGTGSTFPMFLRERLDSMKVDYDAGHPGDLCLIFGPEYTRREPDQHWLAYSLERKDFSLRELTSAKPLHPWLVITGKESPVE
jgi:hypothetical protein